MAILEFDEAVPVLEAVGMAEARDEPLDADRVSQDLGISLKALRATCEAAESTGLILASPDDPREPARLTRAGRQYLALRGQVDEDAVFFLAEAIDNLHARKALMRAGTILVDEFSESLASGWAVEHAEELVPVAFKATVDDRLAIRLFAATTVLIGRLSSGDAAGCVAEEIVAVALVAEAGDVLDLQCDAGEIEINETKEAKRALWAIFDHFGDVDVLELFKMEEPADAALAGHSPISERLGRADQRVEAWFEPFGHVAPTGHLSDRP